MFFGFGINDNFSGSLAFNHNPLFVKVQITVQCAGDVCCAGECDELTDVSN